MPEKIESVVLKADDWISKHNFISRLMTLVVIGLLIYAFVIPLAPEYVKIISYMFAGMFILISVGINSLKLVLKTIEKIKGK